MESSALCLLGLTSNIKTGVILTIDGYVFENIDREKKQQSMNTNNNVLLNENFENNNNNNNNNNNKDDNNSGINNVYINPKLFSKEDELIIEKWKEYVEIEERKGELSFKAEQFLCPGVLTMCKVALDAIIEISV
jgi:hypothetical protein